MSGARQGTGAAGNAPTQTEDERLTRFVVWLSGLAQTDQAMFELVRDAVHALAAGDVRPADEQAFVTIMSQLRRGDRRAFNVVMAEARAMVEGNRKRARKGRAS